MNEKLTAITATACTDLAGFIREKEEDILDAWNAAEQEAIDQEAKPKFRLGFTITLDLDADTMETALGWSVRHKVSNTQQIPDPSQPNLKGMDDATVTIETNGETTGPIPTKVFKAAVKDLEHQMQRSLKSAK
jgi:hypothetical protein